MADFIQKAELVGGAEVKLGAAKYILAPLNVKALKNGGKERLDKLGAFRATEGQVVPTIEYFDDLCAALVDSLSRNYDGVTVEAVQDLLDLGNMAPVIRAIMGINGYNKGEAAQAQQPAPQ